MSPPPDASPPPYAAPVAVREISDCYYYHTMDVPGHGVVSGEWDVRDGVDAYLGYEDVAGKRVLEIGTASGFFCFEMERRGADVVAYDLSPAQSWDVVPYAGLDLAQEVSRRREHVARLNKSWWLNHHAFASRAHVVYGTVYEIPPSIGPIDLCTFGAVLLHVRDPFLALQSAAALRPATIVVTELAQRGSWISSAAAALAGPARRRSPLFLPNALKREPRDAWWWFTPQSVTNMLAMLGYRTERVVRHAPLYANRRTPMFTAVARRA